MIKKSIINGEQYYSFYLNNEYVGKCITNNINNDTILLKYITINEKYRGKDLSTMFYHIFENDITNNNENNNDNNKISKIVLNAEEITLYHSKLVKLYMKWGFQINGKCSYKYNGEKLIRVVPMIKHLTLQNNFTK